MAGPTGRTLRIEQFALLGIGLVLLVLSAVYQRDAVTNARRYADAFAMKFMTAISACSVSFEIQEGASERRDGSAELSRLRGRGRGDD